MQVERGDLPARLTEVMLAQTEVARAAVMWCTGEIHAPCAQLHELAQRLRHLQRVSLQAQSEVAQLLRETKARQAAEPEPEVILGRWSNVA